MLKLLTFNTHSLEEANMPEKQSLFADYVARELPDVIALQEVNQNMDSEPVAAPEEMTVVQEEIPLKKDSHILAVFNLLKEKGLDYHFAWLPIKVGYDRYDEGVAVLTRKPILETDNLAASTIQDYSNYRTRRFLGVRTEDGWFYDIHASWWNDPDEPFINQWNRMKNRVSGTAEPVFLMGDFNGDAAIRNETYDQILSDRWEDTYSLAETKDNGFTVEGQIDGWRDQEAVPARRIDQIWMNEPAKEKFRVKDSRVVFNGRNEPVLSDHYGIQVELD